MQLLVFLAASFAIACDDFHFAVDDQVVVVHRAAAKELRTGWLIWGNGSYFDGQVRAPGGRGLDEFIAHQFRKTDKPDLVVSVMGSDPLQDSVLRKLVKARRLYAPTKRLTVIVP